MYDLIVIGTGPGGYRPAARAGQMGKAVALVEKGLPARHLPGERKTVTKGLPIEPGAVLSMGALHLSDIPVNVYQKPLQEERSRYTTEELVDIWRDMCAIREFETVLNDLKLKGTYRGVAYDHAGPAHLSIGQEGAAVGMAFSLTPEDHIFGSHRSHGEILAKAFSAMRFLSDEQLEKIMRSYREGAVLAQVERRYDGSMVGLAMRFFVYGAYAEIFARDTGLNRGLGGSMHAFFPPFGIYPNNAIVGGSASIAPGAALFKRVNRKPGIVVANIGDAAFGCGPTWEAMTFAAMDQYRKLWDPDLGGGLPVIFNSMDNFYGMGGQTSGETMGCGAHRPGGGRGKPGADARRACERLRPSRRHRRLPAQADSDRRRTRPGALGHRDLPLQWPLALRRFQLPHPRGGRAVASARPAQLLPPAPCRRRGGQGGSPGRGPRGGSREMIFEMFRLAADLEVSPRLPISSELVGSVMFSGGHVERFDDRCARGPRGRRDQPPCRPDPGQGPHRYARTGSRCPR